MSPVVEAPKSVLLVCGREEYTPPRTFGGEPCAATADCVAVAVRDEGDGPVDIVLSPEPAPDDLVVLGRFEGESEGLVSVRDVYNRELDAMGTEPGLVTLTVWGDTPDAPGRVHVHVDAGG